MTDCSYPRWVCWLTVLLSFLPLCHGDGSVEIVSVDAELSGRHYISPQGSEQESVQFEWQNFKKMNFYLGTYDKFEGEAVLTWAFRVDEKLLLGIANGDPVHLVFTICGEHSGDPEEIYPIEIHSLKRNATGPKEALSNPGPLVRKLSFDQYRVNKVYRVPISMEEPWEVGDLIWFGLDGMNSMQGKSHSIVFGGDRIRYPGSIEPQLICVPNEWINFHTKGLTLLNILQYKLRAPSSPLENGIPYVDDMEKFDDWGLFQPLGMLKSFKLLIESEIHRGANIQLQNLQLQRGFHSQTKRVGESWTITIPAYGYSTCVVLIPSSSLESHHDAYGFPKRFMIKAHLKKGGERIVADWSEADFPFEGMKPYL
ncbi:MAG: hypothetical protein HQL32_15530 [Planctomycetes bacterium]|nr:hypothetical protein [Planctomycetota bacterium]